MGLYRRFARAKKGMATIFGGLFFIILILMGFNLMLWGFIQQDAYNSIVTNMNQRDQQAISENLIPQNPGAVNETTSPPSFNILVNNQGGTTVTIAAIYITNISPGSGVTQCSGSTAPCIVNPSPATGYSFTQGNIGAGEINHYIFVSGLCVPSQGQCPGITDTSSYQIILASSRGRLYSFYTPWRTGNTIINQATLFETNIGPLSILFDYSSFEFTSDYSNASSTRPIPAWVTPDSSSIIIWIRVINNALTPVTLEAQSGILFQRYSGTGNSGTTAFYIVDNASICCGAQMRAYSNASPIILPAASGQGPTAPTFIKFSASGISTSSAGATPTQDGTYMLFIGFFYKLDGLFQGETVPFVAVDNCKAPIYEGSPISATSQC